MARLEESLLVWLFDTERPVRRAVFCTYRFDPTFFAEVILPELQRRGCERTLVLMDALQYQVLAAPDDLETQGQVVLERFGSGQLFHPKAFVLAGNGRGRCVIGSANLTR